MKPWFQCSTSFERHLAAAILDQLKESFGLAITRQAPNTSNGKSSNTRFWTVQERLAGKNSHVFHGIVDRYGYIRKFFPRILKHLSFEGQKQKKKPEIIKAIELLRDMNERGTRTLPDDALLDFVSAKYKPFVEEDGSTWNWAYSNQCRSRL
jgi:hypothetical protein